jgi:hypothetical protein
MTMRLARPITIAAVSLAAAAPAAHAQEPDERYCHQDATECPGKFTYGTPFSLTGVETIAPTYRTKKALALYKHVIGPRFELPPEPKARIQFYDIRLGAPVPIVQDFGPAKYDSRYLEYGLALQVRYGKRLGWRAMRLTLNNRPGFDSGRSGATPKFLSKLVFEQDPDNAAGYATTRAKGRLFMRGDWEPDPSAKHVDPHPSTFLGDFTEDGDPWQGKVELATLTGLQIPPTEFLSGGRVPQPLPAPTGTPVSVRVRLPHDVDFWNVPEPADASFSDPDPLPDLFPDGKGLGDIMDLDQEVPGVAFGPTESLLVVETRDITGEGRCKERAACEKAEQAPSESRTSDAPSSPSSPASKPGAARPATKPARRKARCTRSKATPRRRADKRTRATRKRCARPSNARTKTNKRSPR